MPNELKMQRRNLVLLPGLDGTGTLFEPLIQVLPPEIRPLVVQLPPDQILNYQQLIPYIREVAPWDEPYILMAESFSGPLALFFAQAQWENVEAIVLCSSFIKDPFTSMMKWAYSMIGPSMFKSALPKAVLKKYLLGKDTSPALAHQVSAALRSVKPEVLVHRLELILKTDASLALRQCESPVLYIMGSQDELIGRRGWEAVFKARSDVALTEFNGSHLLLQTRPREVWTAVEMFLKRASAIHDRAA